MKKRKKQEITRTTMDLADLNPAAYNPRRISAEAMRGLTASIEAFGLVQEIVVNRRDMTVVGGHQRLEALKKLGQTTKIPVVVVDLEPHEERALNVALNSPAIEGEFSEDLGALLQDVQNQDRALFKALRLDQLVAEEPDAPRLLETKITLDQKYEKIYVLVSIPVASWSWKVEEILEKLGEIEGVEYEQASN